MTARRKLLALTVSALAAAGCEQQRTTYDLPPALPAAPKPKPVRPTPPEVAVRPKPPRPKAPLVRALPSGKSAQGRTITATVIGRGSRCILFIGGIHGNEPAGGPLLDQLLAYLSAHEELVRGLKVIIVPRSNPDGLAANTRENANGVDVNRNFATGNYTATAGHGHSAMSQPEARYLRGIIDRHRPTRIITLHQPLTCIDYDGPGLALATAIARASGLPVKKLGARPGSLGSYAGVENHIPTITVEFPAAATNLTAEQVWAKYGRAMLVGLHYGMGSADSVAK